MEQNNLKISNVLSLAKYGRNLTFDELYLDKTDLNIDNKCNQQLGSIKKEVADICVEEFPEDLGRENSSSCFDSDDAFEGIESESTDGFIIRQTRLSLLEKMNIILISSIFISLVFGNSQLWRDVMIEDYWLNYSSLIKTTYPLNNWKCGCQCGRISWCKLWCPNPETGMYDLYELYASPQHKSENTSNVKCFTSIKRDLVTGSKAYIQQVGFKNVNVNYITIGVYNYDNRRCFFISAYDQWVLVDLGHQRVVSIITLLTPYKSFYVTFGNVEIRLGNELVTDGNFTSYKLLKFISGLVSDHTTVTVNVQNAKGRFLSFQRKEVNERFRFCFLQVF